MTNDNKETNGNGRGGRIEFLRQKLEADRVALGKELAAKAKRDRRESRKLELLLGGAVLKAGAQSAEFRLMIAQTALSHITEEKIVRFLAGKGWSV